MTVPIVLRPNERIVSTFSIGPRYFWTLIGIAVVLVFAIPIIFRWFGGLAEIDVSGLPTALVSLISFLIGLGIVIYTFYYRAARSYVLTNQRIFQTVGWLSKHSINAEYDDITDIAVTQDVFERFFLGVGTVAINTAGGDTHELRFERVYDPHGVGNKIREMCELHQHSHEHREEHGGQRNTAQPNQPEAD